MTGPLDGIRVLDLTRVLSGPFASLMLEELGAEVTKVESVRGGDTMRLSRGAVLNGFAAGFLNLNRGKLSVSIDYSSPEGAAVIRRLAVSADVFMENFRPGVCDAIGLGADRLREVNPELIYVSISGFGPSSPSARESAYDSVIQARTGVASRQGPDGGPPELVRSAVSDKVASLMATQAILAALFARERGAGGQAISVPMFDTTFYYLWPDAANALTFVDGGSHGVPFLGLRLSQTMDGTVAFHALGPREHEAIDAALGIEPTTHETRHLRDAAVAAMSTTEVIARLHAHHIGCSAVAELEDALKDEHVVATGMISEWTHSDAGRVRNPKHPVHYEKTPARELTSVARLGEDTEKVLTSAGYTAEEIARLRDRGIVRVSEQA